MTYLRIPEVAARLSLSRMTVYRLINDGLLQAVQMPTSAGHSELRVAEDDLTKFCSELKPVTRVIRAETTGNRKPLRWSLSDCGRQG